MMRRLAASLAIAAFTACAASSLSTKDKTKDYFNASIGPVNHTDQFLYMFSIERYDKRWDEGIWVAKRWQLLRAFAKGVSPWLDRRYRLRPDTGRRQQAQLENEESRAGRAVRRAG